MILYGNTVTNSAWKRMLADCPVQVTRKEVIFDGRCFRCPGLAALFV
ncbi:MAG: hypothetical protein GXO83_07360 [Chlorobi bacterium]|nr:hypothetical protein [Chlorobiota bacterium]